MTPERGTKPKVPPAPTAARIWQQPAGLRTALPQDGAVLHQYSHVSIFPSEAQLWKGLHQVSEQHPEHRHCIEITLER